MMEVVAERVFPFLRQLGESGSSFGMHMKDARLGFSQPALLSKAVDLLDKIPMQDRDTKGDLYEYMLGKIAIQFVQLIIRHLTEKGVMEAQRLYESPFTDLNDQGVSGLFDQDTVQHIVAVLDSVRGRAAA